MNDDAELLRRYAEEKSEAAFAELVRRHLGIVYHAALRQCGGDAHRAEDVAQMVFTDLARKAEKLARRPVLSGWLYTSTRYAAAQAVRTEARRQAREQEVHAMNEQLFEPGAASAADWEKLRPVIDEALHSLGERDREAVLLRFFEGRPFAELGERLALSEDAARMRVERALEKLRAALGRHGVTSTTAALSLALAGQAGAAAPAGLAASVAGVAVAGSAGGGAMIGLLTFMSINKTSVGVLAAIAGVAALNVGQQQANAKLQDEFQTLTVANQGLHAQRAVERRVATTVVPGPASPMELAELARLKAQAQELGKKLAGRSAALRGGYIQVGNKIVTRDTPPGEKIDVLYHEGRSNPTMAWQTILGLGRALTDEKRAYVDFRDFDMMALMVCLDDPARAKVEAFIASLPAGERTAFHSPERLIAPVFSEWLWQGDWPKNYSSLSGRETDTYVAGDTTRALSAWEVTRTSGRKQIERFPFKRFDDGWRYGPLSVADVEPMLAQLDPNTGNPKVSTRVSR